MEVRRKCCEKIVNLFTMKCKLKQYLVIPLRIKAENVKFRLPVLGELAPFFFLLGKVGERVHLR
jgi:hypothetical protein